jgi:NAD(P)H-dependent glutamate synthase small subunit
MDPVSIRQVELQAAERGWKEGWIVPEPSQERTGRKIAIIGSGPAGLAAAQQLTRSGHEVIVFEKDDRVGGLFRYGVPDFKLEKWVLDRRLEQLTEEGIIFETGVEAGKDISVRYMQRMFEAILIASGAREPRDLRIPGRELGGIHLAMEFLSEQNRRNAGEIIPSGQEITARDKEVVVLGGGDTGSDCVGTAIRQGANSVTQIELLPQPPAERAADDPWPMWPNIMRTSSSHEEGCERLWGVLTKEFVSDGDAVRELSCVRLEWGDPDGSGRCDFKEIPHSGFRLRADLVLLATGFVHVEHGRLIRDLDLKTVSAGNLDVGPGYATSRPGVFAAGDAISGASLVVNAIASGREAAAGIDRYLSLSY